MNWILHLTYIKKSCFAFHVRAVSPFSSAPLWPPSHIITGLIDRTTGDKPHACELCNKRFALACNLRAHMKTHEGKEPNPSILLFVTTPFYCNSFVPKTNDLSHTHVYLCRTATSKHRKGRSRRSRFVSLVFRNVAKWFESVDVELRMAR
jgi:hypothetical protein